MIRSIRSGSAAEDAGLSVNDEIIAVDNFRVDKGMFDAYVGSLPIGGEVEILYSRESELYTTKFTMTGYEQPKFKFSIETEDKKVSALYDFWLGQK